MTHYSPFQDIVFSIHSVMADGNAALMAFVRFNNVYQILRGFSFTKPVLDELEKEIVAFREAAEVFKMFSASDFNFRKFHLLLHWVADIKRHGAPHLYSAEANEMFHKTGSKVGVQPIFFYNGGM